MTRLAQMLLTAVFIVQSVVAQTATQPTQPIRVRVTGVAQYEIPGVITINETRISGRPVTRSASMIRFSRTDGELVISVLQPGVRVTGEARAVERDILEFISDDDRELSSIPVDSIALLERQKSPIASRETARGIGIGTAVGIFGLSYLGALQCQPDEHAEGPCWRLFETLMLVGAPVIGILVGWHVGRVKWERVTVAELRAESAGLGQPQ